MHRIEIIPECPITHNSIVPGQEFTLLSGHIFNARALAAWIAKPDFREGSPISFNPQSADKNDIYNAWVNGKNTDKFPMKQLLIDDSAEDSHNKIRSSWMGENPHNPLNRASLTSDEKTALTEKITLLNYHAFVTPRKDDWDTPSPEQFESWSFKMKYEWLDTLGKKINNNELNGFEYWATARLAAYAITVLAKQLVHIPNRKNGTGVPHVWQITQQLMDSKAFEERNSAVMSILMALPKEQRLNFVDLIKHLQNTDFSPDFQTANYALNSHVAKYIQEHFTPEMIADHGRCVTKATQQAKEFVNNLKTENNSDNNDSTNEKDSDGCSIM